MSHGIYNKDRDFQVSEQVQWHKLTREKTPEKSDFPEIVAAPLFYGDNQLATHGKSKFFIPISTDDNLPVANPSACGEDGSYCLFTPKQAYSWVEEVLAGTGFKVQSLGMLWNRSVWFISTELTELKDMTIGDGRETKFQFNFSGGLDKSMSPQCELSSTICVCANTVSISRTSGKVLFASKATRNFKVRLESAKSEIENAVGMAKIFKSSMDNLAKKPCNKDRAERIFAGYLTPGEAVKMSTRTRNFVTELATLHEKGLGNRGETEFDMLNAYTQALTRGTEKTTVSAGQLFASSEFGGNADEKASFAKLLTVRRMQLPVIEKRGEELLKVPAAPETVLAGN